MGMINRVPKGLLSLLDAKTLGETPKTMADVVQPVLDLSELYASDIPLQVEATASTGQPALGALVSPVTVPAGQTWLVYNVSARWVATANQIGELGIVLDTSSDNSGNVFLAGPRWSQFGGWSTGQTDFSHWQPQRPMLVASGSSFESQVLSGTWAGVNVTITTSVLFRPLAT